MRLCTPKRSTPQVPFGLVYSIVITYDGLHLFHSHEMETQYFESSLKSVHDIEEQLPTSVHYSMMLTSHFSLELVPAGETVTQRGPSLYLGITSHDAQPNQYNLASCVFAPVGGRWKRSKIEKPWPISDRFLSLSGARQQIAQSESIREALGSSSTVLVYTDPRKTR